MRLIKLYYKQILIIACAIAVVVIFQAYQYQSWWRSDVSVWVFDVGQGDAIFIDAKTDVLVDGGPSSCVIEKLSQVLPFWDRSLDFIVNTHPHADHLAGLVDVLRRYQVDEVWTSGQVYETGVSGAFEGMSENIHKIVMVGSSIQLQEDVKLEVLWPNTSLEGKIFDDPNDGSIVLLLTCFNSRILLTGDLGSDQLEQIINYVGDIDVLKVGHHGSSASSSDKFLQAIDPEVAIISVGENDYGHPSQIVLDRLESEDAVIYRTDINGDTRVICSPDGYRIITY
ncbi:MBL fold metallo-hydrolase [Candidatus Parcubacteria bacterium]|nr:MBL fold metallo-hydrolase [Candidatus Parcubacteria bacterium]